MIIIPRELELNKLTGDSFFALQGNSSVSVVLLHPEIVVPYTGFDIELNSQIQKAPYTM